MSATRFFITRSDGSLQKRPRGLKGMVIQRPHGLDEMQKRLLLEHGVVIDQLP